MYVQNLYETSTGFEWIVQLLIKLPFKLLNVKKIKSPETTMSNSIHKAIEAVGKEQPFQ